MSALTEKKGAKEKYFSSTLIISVFYDSLEKKKLQEGAVRLLFSSFPSEDYSFKSRKLLFWKLCQSSSITDNKIVPPPWAEDLLPSPWWLPVPGLSHKCIWTLFYCRQRSLTKNWRQEVLQIWSRLQWKSWKSGSLSSTWTPVHRCRGCFQRQWGLTQTRALLHPKSSVGKRLIPRWSWRNQGLCAMISAGSGFADIIPADGYSLSVIFFAFLLLTSSPLKVSTWREFPFNHPHVTPVETFQAVK